jgi:hypothetical protein
MRTRYAEPITNSEKSHRLIRRLGSRKPEERRRARAEFLRMASDAPALFHADLADIVRVITGRHGSASLSLGALTTCAFVAYLAYLTSFPTLTTVQCVAMIGNLFLGMAVLLMGWLIGVGIFRALLGQHKMRLFECIVDIDALDALPDLIEMLDRAAPALLSVLAPPLTRLLLRLRAHDGHLLGSLHRSALAQALGAPRMRRLPAPFFLAVLHAFEQIGDSQALPTIAWLAQGKGAARRRPVVREAAQQCLDRLLEQMRRHQAPSLLLRPSDPVEDSRNLLRPSVRSSDAAPHELLRAGSSPRR